MYDSGRVSRCQRVGDLNGILQHVSNAQAFAPDQVIERIACHVLHGDVLNRLAIDLLRIDVVDRDDVGMVQR